MLWICRIPLQSADQLRSPLSANCVNTATTAQCVGVPQERLFRWQFTWEHFEGCSWLVADSEPETVTGPSRVISSVPCLGVSSCFPLLYIWLVNYLVVEGHKLKPTVHNALKWRTSNHSLHTWIRGKLIREIIIRVIANCFLLSTQPEFLGSKTL